MSHRPPTVKRASASHGFSAKGASSSHGSRKEGHKTGDAFRDRGSGGKSKRGGYVESPFVLKNDLMEAALRICNNIPEDKVEAMQERSKQAASSRSVYKEQRRELEAKCELDEPRAGLGSKLLSAKQKTEQRKLSYTSAIGNSDVNTGAVLEEAEAAIKAAEEAREAARKKAQEEEEEEEEEGTDGVVENKDEADDDGEKDEEADKKEEQEEANDAAAPAPLQQQQQRIGGGEAIGADVRKMQNLVTAKGKDRVDSTTHVNRARSGLDAKRKRRDEDEDESRATLVTAARSTKHLQVGGVAVEAPALSKKAKKKKKKQQEQEQNGHQVNPQQPGKKKQVAAATAAVVEEAVDDFSSDDDDDVQVKKAKRLEVEPNAHVGKDEVEKAHPELMKEAIEKGESTLAALHHHNSPKQANKKKHQQFKDGGHIEAGANAAVGLDEYEVAHKEELKEKVKKAQHALEHPHQIHHKKKGIHH